MEMPRSFLPYLKSAREELGRTPKTLGEMFFANFGYTNPAPLFKIMHENRINLPKAKKLLKDFAALHVVEAKRKSRFGLAPEFERDLAPIC